MNLCVATGNNGSESRSGGPRRAECADKTCGLITRPHCGQESAASETECPQSGQMISAMSLSSFPVEEAGLPSRPQHRVHRHFDEDEHHAPHPAGLDGRLACGKKRPGK